MGAACSRDWEISWVTSSAAALASLAVTFSEGLSATGLAGVITSGSASADRGTPGEGTVKGGSSASRVSSPGRSEASSQTGGSSSARSTGTSSAGSLSFFGGREAAPEINSPGVGTRRSLSKNPVFFGVCSTFTWTRGTSSRGMSTSLGRVVAAVRVTGGFFSRTGLGEGGGKSSGSYSRRGRDRRSSTSSMRLRWNMPSTHRAASTTNTTPAPMPENTAEKERDSSPPNTPPHFSASPSAHRVLTMAQAQG